MTEVQAGPEADPCVFAERILRAPVWDHQREFLSSRAQYRVINAGRQAGKSRALAILALFEAATRRNVLVLVVSAGETASQRLLEECAALAAGSPELAGSVLDETKSRLVLSNGSRVISVPASERQIRGWPVDVLIIDEAGWVPDAIWQAAEPAIAGRGPSARVVLASSPWGGVDHFFRRLWTEGMDAPSEFLESFHWPTSVNPNVDPAWLERKRKQNAEDVFQREYLALFTSDSGSYFKEAELMANVADYELATVERARSEEWNAWGVYISGLVAGIDWGATNDSSALAVVGVLEDEGLNVNAAGRGKRLYLAALEERTDGDWDSFIRYCAEAAEAFPLWGLVSERNGVGAWPTNDLMRRVAGTGSRVAPAWTDLRRKQSGYGMLKGLLQQRAIVLPAHPRLLSQLRGLQFEQLPGGGMRIAVPDNLGHDDLADALMQAMSALRPSQYRDEEYELLPTEEARLEFRRSHYLGNHRHEAEQAVKAGRLEIVETQEGFKVPRRPRPVQNVPWYWRQVPVGMETGDGF